jgi:hypothetical protein
LHTFLVVACKRIFYRILSKKATQNAHFLVENPCMQNIHFMTQSLSSPSYVLSLFYYTRLFGCAQLSRLVSSGRGGSGLRKRRRLVALIRIAALGGAPTPQRSWRLVLTFPVFGSLPIATVPSSKTWIIFIKPTAVIVYIVLCTEKEKTFPETVFLKF